MHIHTAVNTHTHTRHGTEHPTEYILASKYMIWIWQWTACTKGATALPLGLRKWTKKG